eukprot:Pgem_evm1s18301
MRSVKSEESQKPKYGQVSDSVAEKLYKQYNQKWSWIVYIILFSVIILFFNLPFIIPSLIRNDRSGIVKGKEFQKQKWKLNEMQEITKNITNINPINRTYVQNKTLGKFNSTTIKFAKVQLARNSAELQSDLDVAWTFCLKT